LSRCSVRELARNQGIGFAKAAQPGRPLSGLGSAWAQQNLAGGRIETPEQVV
jgi:hypothetical protein